MGFVGFFMPRSVLFLGNLPEEYVIWHFLFLFANFASSKNEATMKVNQRISDEVSVYEFQVGSSDSGITGFCCADRGIKLFENQYLLPDGMTYNSYIIDDDHIAVMDTVDHNVMDQWLPAVKEWMKSHDGRRPDFLVVHHLEPDHSGALSLFLSEFPDCKVVCSVKAAQMMPHFVPDMDSSRIMTVKEGDTLELGRHTLRFISAPMVHWPEVIMTYESATRTLFSADAFGTFGTSLATGIATGDTDQSRLAELWPDEARRYYINICGKYGPQVQSAMKKFDTVPVDVICPLHGPVIALGDYPEAVSLYETWSSYVAEFPEKVFITVATLHGFTLEVARELRELLAQEGVDAHVADLAETDLSGDVAWAFADAATVFMSATYDAGLTPAMRDFLGRLKSKNWQKRCAAVVENGSWAPVAGKLISAELSGMKDIEKIGEIVTIHTRLDEESRAALRNLAQAVAARIKA